MKVHILLTAIALDQEDVDLTVQAYNSFMACDTSYVKDVYLDTRLHGKGLALTAKWNEFINFYRDRDYDYLMLCANDTIAHPNALEYMVRWMQDNPDIDLMHPYLERDRDRFNQSCNNSLSYNPSNKFTPHETANMIARKGFFEDVGEFDLLFPHEKNEHDYFSRALKMGKKLGTADMRLFYHPPHSQDDPNRQGISVAEENFMQKFGASWFAICDNPNNGFAHPFNNPELRWVDTKQNSAL